MDNDRKDFEETPDNGTGSYDSDDTIIMEPIRDRDWSQYEEGPIEDEECLDDDGYLITEWNKIPVRFIQGNFLNKAYYEAVISILYGEIGKRDADIAEQKSETSSFQRKHAQAEEALKNAKISENAAINRSKDRDREVREREREQDKKERDFLYKKIAMIAGIIILSIATLTTLSMYFSEKQESSSAIQNEAEYQDQLKSLKESIDKEKEISSQLTNDNKGMQDVVDGLKKKLEESNKSAEDSVNIIKDRDKEIDRLNDQLDELENTPPATVTKTVVQRQDPEIRTVTTTVFNREESTTSRTTSNNSDEN